MAGIAGYESWLAFLGAFFVAGLTALSYAELGSRIPRSGGGAAFCLEGFKSQTMSLVVGWMILCSGMVSMATISVAFAGYASVITASIPAFLWIFLFLALLGYINFRGMQESSFVNIVCTTVEASGILLIILCIIAYLFSDPEKISISLMSNVDYQTIFQASAIAFFSFIGFEDLVNVAEDAKFPKRDIPRAILASLSIVSLIYMVLIVLIVRVIPPAELGQSSSPLVDIMAKVAPWLPLNIYSFIAVVAITNTALLNYIMGSRMIYGLAKDKLLPQWLGSLHSTYHTPYVAIIVIFFMVYLMAITGSIVYLAGTTSALLLSVFSLVNLALILIKNRNSVHDGFQVPIVFPYLGLFSALILMCFVPLSSFVTSALLIFLGGMFITLKRLVV